MTSREEKLKAGKFPVDAALVERLIAEQFPQWVGLPVRPVENDGWDNWTFHLGDRMKVRLPSAVGYSEQAEKEATWLPRLAPHLPLPVPVPIGIGKATPEFPCAWSIYGWLEGEPTTRETIEDAVQFGWDVAKFLTALQRIDTTGGPPPGQHNFLRGADPVAAYGADARRHVEKLDGVIDVSAAREVLDAAEAAKITMAPVWIHGDIAVGNLLVRGGRLAAVIDFGGCAVGDPACDLVITWVFLEGAAREAFRLSVAADEPMWARARAWALWKTALLLVSGQVVNSNENSPRGVIEAVIGEHRSVR